MEKEVLIPTLYGLQNAFAVCPEGPGPYPGIILYMDAPGIREELRDMARRIAKAGYYCLLPDLYYRVGMLRFDVARRNAPMSAVIRAAMHSITNAEVVEDTRGMIAFLDAQPQVKAGPLGCVGHCMSGPFVTAVAATFPRMKATASLYGVGVVTDAPDSSHLQVNKIEGEIYYGFAEVDPAVPANVVPDLTAALDKAGTTYELEVLAGAHHGFCFAARPSYDAIASEKVWDTLFALWARHLK
jgi:carboxymethylenebutenolidase